MNGRIGTGSNYPQRIEKRAGLPISSTEQVGFMAKGNLLVCFGQGENVLFKRKFSCPNGFDRAQVAMNRASHEPSSHGPR